MSTQAADVFLQPSKNLISATWMANFFPLRLVLGMLGSLNIAWRCHTDSEPHSIGLHFLAMSAGFVLGSQILNRLRAPLSLLTHSLFYQTRRFLKPRQPRPPIGQALYS